MLVQDASYPVYAALLSLVLLTLLAVIATWLSVRLLVVSVQM